jgi:hypothetical protein
VAAPLAVGTTLALSAAFFAVTAHVAASYLLDDPPAGAALVVGAALAAAAVGARLAALPTAATVALMLVIDAFAFAAVYDRDLRGTALLVVGHVVVSVVLGFALRNLAVLLSG